MSGNKSWDNQCEHTKAALIQQPETKEKNGRLSQAICENERVTKPLTVWVDIAGCWKTLIFRTWKAIHFSLSTSILRHFHFTFHSRSRYQGIFISLFILEMSEPDFHFTFHFSKWVNQISISLFTSRTSNIHSRRALTQTWGNNKLVASGYKYPFLSKSFIESYVGE